MTTGLFATGGRGGTCANARDTGSARITEATGMRTVVFSLVVAGVQAGRNAADARHQILLLQRFGDELEFDL